MTALVTDSEAKLGQLVNEFERICKGRKLIVNVSKNNSNEVQEGSRWQKVEYNVGWGESGGGRML